METRAVPQRGFSLIELMVIVTIVGVLAAIALPLYRDYSVRARVSEVVMAAGPCRSVVSEIVVSATEANQSQKLLGGCVVNPTQYVRAGTVEVASDGAVAIVIEGRNLGGGLPDGASLMLTPLTATGPLLASAAGGSRIVSWRCEPALPVGDRTPLPLRYLPPSCRL